jgi:glycosyltransferase involved in cell wall biosynthesis
MKVMVVTAGLNADPGRSNSYQEAFIEALLGRGHEVVCLCTAGVSNRMGFHVEKSEGRPWRYTLFNSGIYPGIYPQGGVGTRTPLRDIIATRQVRSAVLEIVRAESPYVISLQGLFGFPLALLDDVARMGLRTVFTAHDYFALCPTAHLFKFDEQPCYLQGPDLVCGRCCASSLRYTVFRAVTRLNQSIGRCTSRPACRLWLCRLRNGMIRLNQFAYGPAPARAAYRRRRELAAQHLAKLDVLHCISQVQARLFRQLAGPLPNLRVLPLSPPTLRTLPAPRRSPCRSNTVVFSALNIHSPLKGSRFLTRVFRRLEQQRSGFKLHVYGNAAAEAQSGAIVLHGRYKSSDLDGIAADSDFCVLPSIWHETLGFVGIEMMARGVPLIASDRAGVSEFVEHRKTGFIFDPSSEENLLGLLNEVLDKAELRDEVRANLLATGPTFRSFDEHMDEMVGLLGGPRFRSQPGGRTAPGAALAASGFPLDDAKP